MNWTDGEWFCVASSNMIVTQDNSGGWEVFYNRHFDFILSQIRFQARQVSRVR